MLRPLPQQTRVALLPPIADGATYTIALRIIAFDDGRKALPMEAIHAAVAGILMDHGIVAGGSTHTVTFDNQSLSGCAGVHVKVGGP